MSYQNNPTVPICVAGYAADETHTISGTCVATQVLADLRDAGFPVDFAWLPSEAHGCWIVVSVDIKKLAKMDISADKLCRLAGDIIFNTHACWQAPKVILVGDDVDITDIDELVWAYATRYHPGVNECLYDAVPGNPLAPYLMREWLKDLTKLPNRGGKSVTSLLLPSDFEGKCDYVQSSFNRTYPEEIKQKVLDKWTTYGFKERLE